MGWKRSEDEAVAGRVGARCCPPDASTLEGEPGTREEGRPEVAALTAGLPTPDLPEGQRGVGSPGQPE